MKRPIISLFVLVGAVAGLIYVHVSSNTPAISVVITLLSVIGMAVLTLLWVYGGSTGLVVLILVISGLLTWFYLGMVAMSHGWDFWFFLPHLKKAFFSSVVVAALLFAAEWSVRNIRR